jgi:putative hydrolase of the HAD superfamily
MTAPDNPDNVEALLFDLGGVVVEIDFGLAIDSWATHSRLSASEIRDRFAMDAVYEQHERGEIGAVEYFGHLRAELELDASDEEILAGWNAIIIGDIAESLGYVATAREKLPCYLFSNSNAVHVDTWPSVCPVATTAFDRIFVSFEMGLRKPERAAFEAISEAIGTPLSSVLFFDDTLENVEAARAAGLPAVHVRSPVDVRQALAEIGLL